MCSSDNIITMVQDVVRHIDRLQAYRTKSRNEPVSIIYSINASSDQ